MKATHFGAGNIGRGFIGLLLHQANYEIDFIDVNGKMIDEMNREQSYRVILANEERETFTVSGIKGINSVEAKEEAIESIATSDLVTTAVGPNILKFVAPLIAEGLKRRKETKGQPVNIIACENMVGGSSELQKYVLEHLNEEEKQWVKQNVGFPNAAVDRIVPNQKNERLLDVLVEPFYEWVIDQTGIKGSKPEIQGALFVDNLNAYIERKLFTVNTGHAATAYLGNLHGFKTIAESIEDEKIKNIVLGALEETGKVLISKHKFDGAEHYQYIEKIIKRFSNPFIIDDVQRVGRAPIRKLGSKDRLVAPALDFLSLFNEVPHHLVEVMAAALAFESKDDPESLELQKNIASNGVTKSFSEITGLDEHHILVESVVQAYQKLK
ncbi:mannitol-1-phosphate 5-dehydrogenase [Peribacillus tepidiphilus]|uniref:mannitol-1-phosphate 5-dehydrogenase n=1 Tax=Peribacillus tepidiphilus TaxID=2652445 RepID=UPI0012925E21|nr:mannitol-1-phosphate 5-dehydrogenase [Peribacillus tepidiphilus]